MSICKKVEICAAAAALLPQSAANTYNKKLDSLPISQEEELELQEETQKILEGFGIAELSEVVELSLSMEDFLFGLFLQLPKPSSPLKIASHERWVGEIAQKLLSTLNNEEALPIVSKEDLSKVRHFIEDDNEFQRQSARFSFNNKKTGESGGVALSAMILTTSSDFVRTLDKVFNN